MGVIKMLLKTVTATVLVCFLSACASPTVVQSKQTRDSEMSCDQLKAANSEAQEFEAKARTWCEQEAGGK